MHASWVIVEVGVASWVDIPHGTIDGAVVRLQQIVNMASHNKIAGLPWLNSGVA